MDELETKVSATREWCASPRFDGIVRLHGAREIVEQQGSIQPDYTVARTAAEGFHARLRELFEQRGQITTFGPYSPGQAVVMKRMGIDAIYLGGWATSAKGSASEDPGPDLASYPLSQVPDEAASLVRALLTADRNQHFARARMDDEKRRTTPESTFARSSSPTPTRATAVTHMCETSSDDLSRSGVPGYHIEDQKPGAKKCGHQGGKVLVGQDEQNKRLNAARFQLDIMRVPGIIVARTDAESATFLDNRTDERDQPFILGATNTDLPSYRTGFLTILKMLHDLGLEEIRGHLLFALSDEATQRAAAWLTRVGLMSLIERARLAGDPGDGTAIHDLLDEIETRYAEIWQAEAGLKTYGEAVAEILERQVGEGGQVDMTLEEWHAFASRASFSDVREKAESLGITVAWDPELPKTPEGYYQVRGGIDYAIAKSLAAAPFADLLWMETKTANLDDARQIRAGDPRRVSGEDARLQPLAIVQLGYDRAERRRDAPVSRRARKAGVRVQLHNVRRAPDRRPRRRGVRDGAARRRDARPCPAPAEVPAARIALSNAAVPRRWRPAGRGPDGSFRADRGDKGDGQRIDPAPAPRPDRGADQACSRRGLPNGRSTGLCRGGSVSSCGRIARVQTSWSFGCGTNRAMRWRA